MWHDFVCSLAQLKVFSSPFCCSYNLLCLSFAHLETEFCCNSNGICKLIILLDGEPPKQSFATFNRFSSFSSIDHHINTNLFPVSAEKKHLQSMMLPPQCFPVGMV
ncbi:hypothetical protein ILYODFUR_019872 [Ilyodon furcidens]|uniref:Uncharacterized protein n=1 Tax=Ilyodon furcidens TaxID=33524 RepID=A0ABV0V4H9_9TELE